MYRIFIDEEQARKYFELRKKDASITWDDIINKGLVACEAMVTGPLCSVESSEEGE